MRVVEYDFWREISRTRKRKILAEHLLFLLWSDLKINKQGGGGYKAWGGWGGENIDKLISGGEAFIWNLRVRTVAERFEPRI